MMSPKTSSLSFTDPKLAAAARATGAKLLRVEEAPEGRLIFVLEGIPADFERLVINDELQVSVRAFLMSMEEILGLIAAAKRRRGAR